LVTDADFERASEGGAESGAQVAQKEAQQAYAPSRTDSPRTTKAPENPGLLRIGASDGECTRSPEMAGTGFEPATSTL
jgi:hypothetical protein